jgi:hypothetical protein
MKPSRPGLADAPGIAGPPKPRKRGCPIFIAIYCRRARIKVTILSRDDTARPRLEIAIFARSLRLRDFTSERAWPPL